MGGHGEKEERERLDGLGQVDREEGAGEEKQQAKGKRRRFLVNMRAMRAEMGGIRGFLRC